VIVSGHAPALPLIRHLAESFSTVQPGTPIEVAPALSGDGALRALEDGRLDLAITLESGDLPEGSLLARSELVLALGRGIESRSFTLEQLSELWAHRTSADGDLDMRLLYGTRNDPFLKLLSPHIPTIAQDILTPMPGGRAIVNSTPGALARQAGTQRKGATLALAGNLRMLGIPVWMGTLPGDISTVHIVARGNKTHPRVDAFLQYIHSPEGRRVIADVGFVPGESP
jgi:DNA-binding transcriptional LysR family regulator